MVYIGQCGNWLYSNHFGNGFADGTCHPPQSGWEVNVKFWREIHPKGLNMTTLNVLGSLCSIAGLAFAVWCYIKAKHKK